MKIIVKQQSERSVSFYEIKVPDECERVEIFEDDTQIICSGIKFKDESVINLARGGLLEEVAFVVYHMQSGEKKMDLVKHKGLPPPSFTVI